jgi:hypothetical protein
MSGMMKKNQNSKADVLHKGGIGAAILGAIGSIAAIMGFCVPCLLASFGILGGFVIILISFITKYRAVFLGIGIALIVISIIIGRQGKKRGTCSIRHRKKS